MGTLDAVRRYFDAWICRDADAVLASMTDDGTYEDPGTGGPIAGDALRGYMQGLWTAFPDLTFEEESLAETGPASAAAQWRMRGTNSGPIAGMPPTGRPIHTRGADFFTLREGRIATVAGYFDSAAVPRQLGLDVIVQPREIGPFRFGTSTAVQPGPVRTPGALVLTYIEARNSAAAEEVTRLSRPVLIEMLGLEGFAAATTARQGLRAVTISAWESREASARMLGQGAHAAAMRPFYAGDLASAARISTWVPDRLDLLYLRCEACGRMNRDPAPGAACRCGAPLREPIPYW
ncbi:MAG: ester cyclase [Amaricoccus sp.]